MKDILLLDLPTHAFEFFNKGSDFLKNALFFREVLRIKRTHLWRDGIKLSSIIAGKLSF
jgi:hypothetical protein